MVLMAMPRRPARILLGLASPAVLALERAVRAQSVRQEGCLNLQSRLDSLKDRHSALDKRIADEDHRPRPDSGTLAKLKVEKLRLKEEITRIAAR